MGFFHARQRWLPLLTPAALGRGLLHGAAPAAGILRWTVQGCVLGCACGRRWSGPQPSLTSTIWLF